MKRLIGFQEPYIVNRLKRNAMNLRGEGEDEWKDDCETWLLQTPAAGIPAFEDVDASATVAQVEATVVPHALCNAWHLYLDVETDEVKRSQQYGDDGNILQLKVANLSPQLIPGSRWIGATRYAGGVFLIDWLLCPAP
jgi:hypothetical protein